MTVKIKINKIGSATNLRLTGSTRRDSFKIHVQRFHIWILASKSYSRRTVFDRTLEPVEMLGAYNALPLFISPQDHNIATPFLIEVCSFKTEATNGD